MQYSVGHYEPRAHVGILRRAMSDIMRVPSILQRPHNARRPLKFFLVCVCLTLFSIPAASDIESLRDLAEQGDAAASQALAERYLHGDGVDQDDAQAAYWYRRAAELGYDGTELAETAVPAPPATSGRRIVSPPLEPAADDARPEVPDSPAVIEHADTATDVSETPPDSTETPAERVTAPKPERDPDTDEASIAAAAEAVEAGDYAAALKQLYPEAMQDNPAAQTLLGDLYMQGLGVQQSRERAMLWYRRAARHDYARAQFNLGNMYFMGEGVLQDDDAALEWYGLAAAQGHEGARNNLHNLERRRETRISPLATRPPAPVAEIQEEVLTALETESEEAAQTGTQPEAAVAVEDAPAEDSIEIAATDTTPVTPLAPGRVVSPPIHTLDPIEPLAETLTPDTSLEPAAEETGPERPVASADDAGNHSESAAMAVEPEPPASGEPDDAESLYERGQQLALGDGTRRDSAAAIEYYRRAAELGHAAAQYRLAAAYHYGEGIGKDPALAATWYRRAAEQGFTMAQRNLGNLYLRGEGVTQDKVQALAWLSLVAVRGSDIDRQQQEQLAGSLSEAELERARELAAEYSKL